MSYANITRAVYHEPWAISRAGFATIKKVLSDHVASKAEVKIPHIKGERPTEDFFGQPIPQYRNVNGVDVLPITGPLFKGAGLLEKLCGATSYEDIQADLRASMESKSPALVLHINSPGGTVVGLTETGDMIRALAAQKMVVAFIDGLGCSAAYWLACSASMIIATPSAIVGSIGTICELLDSSKAYDMQGLKVEQFTGGDLKGTGSDGVPLSDAQREWLQQMVDAETVKFHDYVTTQRPGVSPDDMRGQWFMAQDCANKNLVDGFANSLEECLKNIS